MIDTFQLNKADLIFIDNPVGTGYSYVDSNEYTTDVQVIKGCLQRSRIEKKTYQLNSNC